MPTPWEKYQQRRNNPYRGGGGFKGRALAQAKINEYQYPYEMGSVTSVEVDPEIEEQKRREAAEAQKQKMRGILSGPAALFPNLQGFKEGDGLKLGVDETAIPKREQEISGKQNPFKWALSKTVAPTLEKWQEITEATAGLVATPFSSELTSLKNQGISAGERWRSIELPTMRVGKAKGEGIGFDVGVKGAVELLVDPVGWATTVMPIGLAFRAASFPARKLGAVAGKVSGITKRSDLGKEAYLTAAKSADTAIKKEFDNVTGDIFAELYERNVLNGPTKSGGLGKLEEARLINEPNPDMNILMNYDEIMSSKDQIGYVDGLLAYINDRATAAEKRRSGTFFRAMNNAVQKFRPSVAKRMSPEGRIETYYNQYISAIPTNSKLVKANLENTLGGETYEDIFKPLNLKKKTVEGVASAREGADPLLFQSEQLFITPKIASQTVKMNVPQIGRKTADTPSAKYLESIEDVTGLSPDSNLRVRVDTDSGTVNIGTSQGFSIGTLRINVKPTTSTSKIDIGATAAENDRLIREINDSLTIQNKRQDMFQVDDAIRYEKDRFGNYTNYNSATFEFEPSSTVVWALPKLFQKKTIKRKQRFREEETIVTGAESATANLREQIARNTEVVIDDLEKLKRSSLALQETTGAQKSDYLRQYARTMQSANTTYKNAINSYFDETRNFINNATDIKQLQGLRLNARTIGLEDVADVGPARQFAEGTILRDAKSILNGELDSFKTQFDNTVDFLTPEDALLSIRNLDDGLRSNQLRVNVKASFRDEVDPLFKNLDEKDWNGITREIIRAYARDKNQNLDFLISAKGAQRQMFKKSDAFRGSQVYKDLENLFDKSASRFGKTRTGKNKLTKELRAEIKKLYGLSINDIASMEKEMPFLQFLDMAGTVVGHSHSTGKPIRLYDTGYFDLDNKQIKYLERFYDIFDRGGQMLREEGALRAFDDVVLMKTSNYVHHLVEQINEVALEFDVTEKLLQRQNISSQLQKKAFEKKRAFTDFISDGFDELGLKYLDDPSNLAEAFSRSVQESIAATHLKNKVRVLAAKDLSVDELMNRVVSNVQSSQKINKALKLVAGGGSDDALRKAFSTDYTPETKAFLRQEAPELARELEKMQGSIDSLDINYFVNNNIGKNTIDELESKLQDKLRIQSAYEKRILETEKKLKFRTPEEFGKGIFKRKTYATRERVLKRYNGSKDGQNIYGLEDILFDDKIATNIENTLGIAEPGAFDRFADATSSITDKVRFLQTAIDLGTPLLQGLPTLVRNPVLWGKATKEMFVTVFYPSRGGAKIRTDFYKQNIETIRRMNRVGINMSGTGNDYFRALDNGGSLGDYARNKGFANDNFFTKSGDTLDKGVARFQDGFEHFGDMLRVGLYDAHEKQILRANGIVAGSEADRLFQTTGQVNNDAARKQLTELGEYVNQMTGAFSHTQNMISRRQANIERTFLFFSPAYTRASMGLIGSVLSGGLKGKEAHTAIRNMLAVGVGMHTAIAAVNAEARGEPIEKYLRLDPSKSDFLTTDIGGVKVGVGSFWNSSFKLFARILEDPSFRGDVLDSPLLMTGAGRGQAGFDESGIKSKIANNPVVQWLRGRSSPAGSQFWNLGMGSNYLGEELSPVSIDAAQEIGSALFPFWFQNFFDAGFANGATSAPFEFLGARTFEIPPWERRDAIRDELAMLRHDTLWRELNDLQKKLILDDKGNKNVQRLEELDAEIKEKRRVVGGGELDNQIDDYYADIENAQSYYKSETEKLLSLLHNRTADENGIIIQTPADVIKNEKRIRGEKNAYIQLLDDPTVNPQYQNVVAYFDSFDNFDKTERPEDYFAEKYADIYFSPEWENFNFYDFRGRDEAIALLKSRWGGDGEQLEQYAKNLLFGRKLQVDPLITEYYIGVDKYFDLYYKGAHDAIFTNKYRGEFDELYERFRKAGVRDQELILEKNKRFRKALNSEVGAVRESMRKIDPALDAFLYRFRVGGITKPMHQFNLDRVDELNQLGHMDEYVPQWRVAGQ